MPVSILIILAILLGAILFLAQFHRDPKRNIPQGNNIISPADGWVVGIVDLAKKEEMQRTKGKKQESIKVKKGILGKITTVTKDMPKEAYLISIFMTVFDVHVNRSPVSGKILSVQHELGGFKNTKDLNALENERVEYIIENTELGKLKVIQIAGLLARRILPWKKDKDIVKKGERIGKITLGSQVTMIIPKTNKLKLNIQKGQHVKAGSTIIARY